jgi:hypothetical protein
MTLRCCARGAGLALLIAAAPWPAQAESQRIVLSERQLAAAIRHVAVADEVCTTGRYALYRQTCTASELNVSPDRVSYQQVSTLDRLVLFADRHKDLNLRKEFTPGTRIHFRAGLTTLYEQEAHIELRVRIGF